jgi:hypothetical protein
VVDERPDWIAVPVRDFDPPQPPDAVQALAPAADQDSVVLPPLTMLLGVAVKVTAGGGGVTGGDTETVAD